SRRQLIKRTSGRRHSPATRERLARVYIPYKYIYVSPRTLPNVLRATRSHAYTRVYLSIPLSFTRSRALALN
uniref:Uncharacterized protein n=1 Tax=Oryza brachyantha TaxID=4533 RepID=J3LH27_ORYBR